MSSAEEGLVHYCWVRALAPYVLTGPLCGMTPDAKIRTTDLEQALDYLEGLSFIMRSF